MSEIPRGTQSEQDQRLTKDDERRVILVELWPAEIEYLIGLVEKERADTADPVVADYQDEICEELRTAMEND